MVKFFITIICSSFIFLDATSSVLPKIRLMIGSTEYFKYEVLIKKIFRNSNHYYINGKIDINKVSKTLKDNGLLNIFFKEPRRVHLRFITSNDRLLSLKVISTALLNLGYYNYNIGYIGSDNGLFIVDISYKSEYALDVVLLNDKLQTLQSSLVDFKRIKSNDWVYYIDTHNAVITNNHIRSGTQKRLSFTFHSYLGTLNNVNSLVITSPNLIWYPEVSFFDRHMNLIRTYSSSRNRHVLNINVPKSSYYVKIGDRYRLENLKRGATLLAK